MGTRNNRRMHLLASTMGALALGLLASACSDDAGEAGPGGPNLTNDGSVTTVIDGGVGIDATVPNTGSDAGDAGGQQPTGDCKGTDGCYSCAPTKDTTNLQLLNTCSTGCRPFKNSERIPGFTGTLPAL